MSSLSTNIQKRAAVFVATALGLGIIFDLLFYSKLPGVSFPLYVTLVLGVLFLFIGKLRPRTAAAPLTLLALPILFFAGMVAVNAGGLLIFINIITTLSLLGLFLVAVFRPRIPRYVFLDYAKIPLTLLTNALDGAQRTITDAAAMRKFVGQHESAPQIIRGVLITLPILLLFGLLFSSADLIFRKYLTDIFSFHIDDDIIAHTIMIAVVTGIFTGVFGMLAQKHLQQPDTGALDKPKRQHTGAVEATILFTSLNVLFLGFIALQLTYLFGGQENITVHGFTYAQYARKGFFELIAVAVLTFVLVMVAEKLLRRDHQHTRQFKWLAGALIAQVMIIMGSAFSRLSLYESAYGYTSLRLYSHIFIVWLAVVFCILLYKILKGQRESTFAFLTLLSVLVWLAAINIVNIDALAARKNVARYQATGKIDLSHLAQLSDDAVVDSVNLLDAQDAAVRDEYAVLLYEKRHDLLAKDRHWQSANLSRTRALDALNAREPLLNQAAEKEVQKFNK